MAKKKDPAASAPEAAPKHATTGGEGAETEEIAADVAGEPQAPGAAESAEPEATPDEAEAAEAAGREARIAELEAEVAVLTDRFLRAKAETENLRRRAERERADAAKYAATSFARDMVVVADNLHRAINSIPAEERDENELLKTLIEGVEMTERELAATFERHEIRRIEALDQPFEPEFHQAMYEVEDASKPVGTVVHESASGYTIHDRLLRPAMVAVSKGGPRRETGDAAEPAKEPKADDAGDDKKSKAGEKACQETKRATDEDAGAGKRYDGNI